MRQGVIGSLRSDMRAVASYALEADPGSAADKLVEAALAALDAFDGALLQTSREESPDETKPQLLELLESTVSALDEVIATVPADILVEARAQVDLIEGGAPAPKAEAAGEDRSALVEGSEAAEAGAAASGAGDSSSKDVAKQADLFL